MPKLIRLDQTLLDIEHEIIRVRRYKERDLDEDVVNPFLEHDGPIGLSPAYSNSQSAPSKLVALALAIRRSSGSNRSLCLIVEFQSSGTKSNGDIEEDDAGICDQDGRNLLQKVLCRPSGNLLAFDFGPLAMSLYCDLKMRIINGVDIQTTFLELTEANRQPLESIRCVVNNSFPIFADNINDVFSNNFYDKDRLTDLAMRAWISQYLAQLDDVGDQFDKTPMIDTVKLSSDILDVIGKLTIDALRLEQEKPTEQTYTFTSSNGNDPERGIVTQSNRFQERLRPTTSGQRVRVQFDSEDSGFALAGQISRVSGRSADIATLATPGDRSVRSLTTIGKDKPTTAEAQRAATILHFLQGSIKSLTDNPWIKNIWFSSGTMVWPAEWKKNNFNLSFPSPDSPGSPTSVINTSQASAIKHMLSSSNHIVLIQGPPGTGKTTVIATFVKIVLNAQSGGLWLVAQSNIAVKNIAEKLAGVGLTDWRVLISRDFYFEWHEHLYSQIQSNVIISDEVFKPGFGRKLQGCKVVLCTLSMLSNQHIIQKFTFTVSLKTLVVDEASQIEVGDYIPVFAKFQSSLKKVCFIGDDKQLPPYGQEEIEDLKSIFEIEHLRSLATMLDTQYRMPPQIGGLISDAVYDGKLQSNPEHPITDQIIACHFIDANGNERLQKTSYSNEAEIKIILQLAQHLQDQGKNYRIITPYDAQRSMMENQMKEIQGLQWENKCFNVDSFQGNEEDYIIISLVRTRALGFLQNLRRTNVMLTRCKRGMYIVTSHAFLNGVGGDSLVGHLVKSVEERVGEKAWLGLRDVEAGKI